MADLSIGTPFVRCVIFDYGSGFEREYNVPVADVRTFCAAELGTPTTLVLTNATGLVTAGIVNGAVTYAKIQDVSATDKLLGRSSSGAGDVEEIACTAAGRALLDDATAALQRATLGVAALDGTEDFTGFQMTSTTKGLVLPRMTAAQRDAISSPVDGSLVYATDTDVLSLRANGAWVTVTVS